ncbi:MAG TPA: AI-2E family transporter, partial [Acidimicrobiales bacterium]|nr:AI-2E family transporter [Acidimicrobiales bacterium]
ITYLAGRLIYKLRDILLLIVIAGFIALLLNPLVVALQHWRVKRRGYAVAMVTLWAVLVFAGLAVAFGYPLVNGITHFTENLPSYINKAEHGKGWIGHLVSKYHVKSWVDKNIAPKLTSYAHNLSKPALSVGKGALSLIVSLFVIFTLVLLLLLEGPKLRRGLLSMMEPERAKRYSGIAGEVSRSVTGFMLGNFITSLIAGTVVYVTLLLLGVPFALLWGLWVALVDFLPLVGGLLAGVPTVLFAAVHSLPAGIVTLVVFLVYTQVENHVLNPVVMSRTVRINPLLVLIAILVGANIGSVVGGIFGGFVGTLLAIPVAGSIQVIVREIWKATEPEPPPDADDRSQATPGGAAAGATRGASEQAISTTEASTASAETAAGSSQPQGPPGEPSSRNPARIP